MFHKRTIVGKITNVHFLIFFAVYVAMSLIQIGLPDRFESLRQVLTWLQLGLMGLLAILVLINLFRNWE